MKQVFTLAASALLSISLFAQQTEPAAELMKSKSGYTSFVGLNVAGNFSVTLAEGETYTSVLEVDSRIADFCRAYVMGSILYINVDEKTLPSEGKKILSKKGAQAPVLRATVTIPSGADFRQITLDGNARIAGKANFSPGSSLSVECGGSSVLGPLNVNVAELSVNASKKASVNIDAVCSKLNVVASNNTELSLKGKMATVSTNLDGSAKLTLDATSTSVVHTISGSARISHSGSADRLELISRSNAVLEAGKLSAKDVWTDMNGSEATVSASQKLKLTLVNMANLSYNGSPAILIDKIQKSTVTPLTKVK